MKKSEPVKAWGIKSAENILAGEAWAAESEARKFKERGDTIVPVVITEVAK